MNGVPFDVAIHYDEPSCSECCYQLINNSVSWSGRSVRVVGFEEFGSCEVEDEKNSPQTTLQKVMQCLSPVLLFPLFIGKCYFRLTHHFHYPLEPDPKVMQLATEYDELIEECRNSLAAVCLEVEEKERIYKPYFSQNVLKPPSYANRQKIANAPIIVQISSDVFQQKAICKSLRYDPEPFCMSVQSVEGDTFLIPSKIAQGIYGLESGDLKDYPFATRAAICFLLEFSYGRAITCKVTLEQLCDIHALSELWDYPKLKKVVSEILFAECNCHVERIRVLAPYFIKHPCAEFWSLFERLPIEEKRWIDRELIMLVESFSDSAEKNRILGFYFYEGYGGAENIALGRDYLEKAARQVSTPAERMISV